MSKPLLVIGNRNYSSWSLRAWLALSHAGIRFDLEVLPLDTPEFEARIGDLSPSRRVPALWYEDQCIWDSLAIAEYANELADNTLWPADRATRAYGRSLAAEMHAGFAVLRDQMPMNCRARDRTVPMTPDLERDIARLTQLWTQARERYANAGPWLLGGYSIADAMYAPVALRFRTYGVSLTGPAQAYATTLINDAVLAPWLTAAAEEPWTNRYEEAGL